MNRWKEALLILGAFVADSVFILNNAVDSRWVRPR